MQEYPLPKVKPVSVAEYRRVLREVTVKITVRQISTPVEDLKWSEPEWHEDTVLSIMRSEKLDIIPVKTGKPLVLDYWQAQHQGSNYFVAAYHKPVSPEDFIGPETQVLKLIELFATQGRIFYFLGSKQGLEGIVTWADLDRPPTRILVFTLLSYFELALWKSINSYISGGECIQFLKPKRQDELTRQATNATLEMPVETYFLLTDLVRVVTYPNCEKVRTKLGYSSSTQAAKTLNPLVHYRDWACHPIRPLVSIGGGVFRLWQRLEFVLGFMENPSRT